MYLHKHNNYGFRIMVAERLQSWLQNYISYGNTSRVLTHPNCRINESLVYGGVAHALPGFSPLELTQLGRSVQANGVWTSSSARAMCGFITQVCGWFTRLVVNIPEVPDPNLETSVNEI